LTKTGRESALDAACEAVRRCGLNPAGARMLRESHNTVVLLPEAAVVAKVTPSRNAEALGRELAVGLHLAARDAPTVRPLSDGAAGPYDLNGRVLTLWSYCPPGPAREQPGVELGRALRAFHEALADFAGPLPPFTEKVADAAALFADPTATPELSAPDRQLTAAIYGKLRPRLETEGTARSLHGEPHSHNVIWAPNGPVFVDFEAVCVGPVEWDLGFLPEQAREAFPERDRELIASLREAISFCIAGWCWAQRGRTPEIDEAADFHLDVLRRTAGEAS
jgi:Ser/Thr protein kinase RdoA (MazF antagonist)